MQFLKAKAVTYADGDQEVLAAAILCVCVFPLDDRIQDWPIDAKLLASARVSALGRMQMPQPLSSTGRCSFCLGFRPAFVAGSFLVFSFSDQAFCSQVCSRREPRPRAIAAM